MPGIITGGSTHFASLLPVAPKASDSAATFPTIANNFFTSMYLMVTEVNLETAGLGTATLALTIPPSVLDATFAADGDAFVAGFASLVTSINTIISNLSLPCSNVSTLPATPSRGSDPTNFASEGAAFLAALTTMRTEINAFIAALNAYNPASTRFDGTGVHWDSITHTWDAG